MFDNKYFKDLKLFHDSGMKSVCPQDHGPGDSHWFAPNLHWHQDNNNDGWGYTALLDPDVSMTVVDGYNFWVSQYAADTSAFYCNFASGMIALTELGYENRTASSVLHSLGDHEAATLCQEVEDTDVAFEAQVSGGVPDLANVASLIASLVEGLVASDVNISFSDGVLTAVLMLPLSISTTVAAGALSVLSDASAATAKLGVSVSHPPRILLSQDVGKPTLAPTTAPTYAPTNAPTNAPTLDPSALSSLFVDCIADPLEPPGNWGSARDPTVGKGIVATATKCWELCIAYSHFFMQEARARTHACMHARIHALILTPASERQRVRLRKRIRDLRAERAHHGLLNLLLDCRSFPGADLRGWVYQFCLPHWNCSHHCTDECAGGSYQGALGGL